MHTEPVDPGEVFQSLETERAAGTLSQTVTSSLVKYQASFSQPGYLEQLAPYGKIKIGTFYNGKFSEKITTSF